MSSHRNVSAAKVEGEITNEIICPSTIASQKGKGEKIAGYQEGDLEI
jgi:hypothetical protein